MKKFSVNSKWRVFLILFAVFCTVFAFVWQIRPEYKGFVVLFFYTIPANSFIPFPHEPAILYYGKFYSPALIAVFAGIATCFAGFIDYEVLTPVFEVKKIKQWKKHPFYKKCVEYFYKMPFIAIVFAGFSPVPYYPFRVLAISTGYPMRKYLLAVFLGRAPRYYILAYTGYLFSIPDWVLILIGLIIVAFTYYGKILHTRNKDELRKCGQLCNERHNLISESESSD